jgi:hypothetical protein
MSDAFKSPETVNVPDEIEEDPMALTEEFMKIKEQVDKIMELKRISKDRSLTPSELELIAKEPELCRKGIEISRKLRRTNTGPAMVKTKKGRAPSKKAMEQAELDKLFNT